MGKIVIPNTFMGVKVEGALERVLKQTENNKGTKKRKSSARNVAPANPTGLIGSLRDYVILPSKNYGSYSYPDVLVGINRISATPQVVDLAGKAGLIVNDNDQGYIGNIDWKESQKLVNALGGNMLTPRQFVDFLEILRSKNSFYGDGTKVSNSEAEKLYNEIVEVRNPWRTEWLNAQFRIGKKKSLMEYVVDGVTEQIPLRNYLKEDKTPGISLNEWLFSADKSGLPSVNQSDGEMYYYAPINGRVAGFDANSNWAYLYCVEVPSDTYSSLGVRLVRKKI